jgi:hypothetical protein
MQVCVVIPFNYRQICYSRLILRSLLTLQQYFVSH